MQPTTPAAPAVRTTLERVLASNTFSRSERARDLLRYLVEREQAGQADRLKGYAIAVDVFGKDTEFDPSTDAVVRVQAGRLRDLLQQYFATEGASDPLQIVIPRGSYIPSYVENQTGEGSGDEPIASEPSHEVKSPAVAATRSFSLHIALMWAAIGVVTLMMAMLFLRQTDLSGFIENSRTGSIAGQGPDALPVIYIEASADTPEQVSMLATLRSGLSGFDTLDFIGRDFQGTPDPVANATSFAFKITSGHQQGSVTVELQNIGNGRVLHSRTFSPQELSPERIEDSVAALLSTTNTASGIIYAYIEQAGVQAGLTKCLLLNDDYYQDPREQTHRAAYSCFEKLIEQGGKSPLIYSEMAVLDLQTVTSGYSYPADASRERALSMGRKAVQMGATSSYAHRAYGYLNSRLGNTEESIHWMRKAYELNTYDLSMAAAYAYVLIFAGEYAAATPIMARAVDGSSARPAWWDFGLFLSYFMQGDMDKAANAAAGLNPASERSHYLVARLIAAHHTGDVRTRDQLLTTLKDRFPYFSAKPRRVLEERKYPPDMVDKLLGALQAAGLGDAR
ncbi:hypothetical protein MIC97_06350 [Aquamicrobium sp. NLF2-7]|uniref:tetratricopeptide repeat protein n=1 Tax=Aquamicrobium sp. NLF2-7 TaxID=2918753 RepID=UPI001EFB2F3B|nr:hypothetical protein [Aquamicrobium sp. NLF2-7]MCG8271131.1 hypothetical protein [Aquamicrobium sp. NLF2-7]